MSDVNAPRKSPGTALLVGASRGLGLGLVQRHLERGWRVIATVRTPSEALQALAGEAGDRLRIETLDINQPAQIAALADRLDGMELDLLFVVAGVAHAPTEPAATMSNDEFDRVLHTNALAPMRVLESLGRLVPAGGTLAAMTSSLGSIAGNETGGYETYRASKAALNMLLRSFAIRHADTGRTVLAVCPGWVRTDMGGPQAPLDVETSTRETAGMLEARRGSGGMAFVNHANQDVAW